MAQAPDWIAADYRAGLLRLFAIAADGRILGETAGPAPANGVAEAARLLMNTLPGPAPMLLCGAEAEPRSVPCAPLPSEPIAAQAAAPQIRLLPPLAQAAPRARSDGAEARAAGLLARRPDFDGVVCVVGPAMTHWLHLSAGEVVSLQGFATGALLAGLAAPQAGVVHADAFDAALTDVLSRPERLAGALGTAQLDTAADRDAATLGALAGAELAATRAYWLGQAVTVIGDGPLAAAMVRALQGQGAAPQSEADTPLLLAGLAAARG